MSFPHNNIAPEDLITVEDLARRLGWSPKTVQNKMHGKDAIFKRGVHFDSPPGMPTLFRWSTVLALYRFDGERTAPTAVAGVQVARYLDRLASVGQGELGQRGWLK